MPNIKRLYIITDASKLDQAETDAEKIDLAGIGTGSFAEGMHLSDDKSCMTYCTTDLQSMNYK